MKKILVSVIAVFMLVTPTLQAKYDVVAVFQKTFNEAGQTVTITKEVVANWLRGQAFEPDEWRAATGPLFDEGFKCIGFRNTMPDDVRTKGLLMFQGALLSFAAATVSGVLAYQDFFPAEENAKPRVTAGTLKLLAGIGLAGLSYKLVQSVNALYA